MALFPLIAETARVTRDLLSTVWGDVESETEKSPRLVADRPSFSKHVSGLWMESRTACFSGPSVSPLALGRDCGLAQTLGREEAGGRGCEDHGLPATNRFEGRMLSCCHSGEDFEPFSSPRVRHLVQTLLLRY